MSTVLDLVGMVQALLSGGLQRLQGLAFNTPDPGSDQAVVALWRTSLFVAAPLAVIGVALGTSKPILNGRQSLEDWRSLLIRIFLTVAAMAFSLKFFGGLISLNNALITAFMANPVLQRVFWHPESGGELLNQLLLAIPYGIVLMLLVLAYVLRLMELFVLAALGPLMVLFYLWPETSYVATGWLQESAVLIFSQFVQAVIFMLATAQGNGPGNDGSSEGVLNSIALLYIALRVPGLLRRLARTGPVPPVRIRIFG